MWILAAIAVVALLGGYALWLHYQLWQQRRRKTTPSEPSDPGVREEQHLARVKSLYLLADALLEEKMTATEGCLRLCAIAAHLHDSEQFRREYGVLFRVAEATAHFPILDDWKALSPEAQRRYTRERQEIEARYMEAVVEAARRIKQHYPL
ncbi:MAG: hypothetical protein CMK32_13245 [Porticoccaceae bacterium]|nr:hypothetical protein [Porticoccaceae bacterium]